MATDWRHAKRVDATLLTAIGTTPAVESGLTDRQWTMEELLQLAAEA